MGKVKIYIHIWRMFNSISRLRRKLSSFEKGWLGLSYRFVYLAFMTTLCGSCQRTLFSFAKWVMKPIRFKWNCLKYYIVFSDRPGIIITFTEQLCISCSKNFTYTLINFIFTASYEVVTINTPIWSMRKLRQRG